MQNQPTVSVFMMAYNHGPYVAQAIESVLQQQTTFPVELVIGEDCSTDNTREIVARYQQQYPDRIKALLHPTNVGPNRNQLLVFEACTGKYVAMLEADDYWTNPHKLQMQVDFLESHPQHSMCFHDAEIIWEDNSQPASRLSEQLPALQQGQRDFTHDDVVRKGWFMPTAALVFRRDYIVKLPTWFGQVFSGDYSLHLLISEGGLVHYFPEVMSCYRKHAAGASQDMMRNPRQLQKRLFETVAYQNHFAPQYRSHFQRTISELHLEYGYAMHREKKYAGMFQHWLKALAGNPVRSSRMLLGWLTPAGVKSRVKSMISTSPASQG